MHCEGVEFWHPNLGMFLMVFLVFDWIGICARRRCGTAIWWKYLRCTKPRGANRTQHLTAASGSHQPQMTRYDGVAESSSLFPCAYHKKAIKHICLSRPPPSQRGETGGIHSSDQRINTHAHSSDQSIKHAHFIATRRLDWSACVSAAP
jgi:hypothetical protein